MAKYNTIIFVPHARARFRQLTISNRTLAAAAAVVACLLVAAIAFAWAFFASSRRDRQYRIAMAENDRLRAATAALHQKLDGISKQLSDFETRTRRLAIVAGLTDSVRGGLGGPAAAIPPADVAGESALLSSRLSLIEKQFSKRFELVASTPTVWPVHGAVNSGFGIRPDPFTGQPAFHEGVDISTARSEPVLATADGTVLRSGWAGEYGKAIALAHGERYETVYGHLEETLVAEGQRVHRGDRVGLVGSTGRSTAPHLHYEVRVDGHPVNPLEYILETR
ncbi:MAG TPA: M23 family metallopeptidase [Thermoanaerobaculia bacterium]|nr:M23 family metallopeptidase [Thermoanaerobaculia bacterium]